FDLSGVPSLQRLRVVGSHKLETIDLRGLTNLRVLDLSACDKLATIQGLTQLAGLEAISLAGCEKVKTLNELRGLGKLGLAFVSGHPEPEINALINARPDLEVNLEERYSIDGRVWNYQP